MLLVTTDTIPLMILETRMVVEAVSKCFSIITEFSRFLKHFEICPVQQLNFVVSSTLITFSGHKYNRGGYKQDGGYGG